VLCCFYVSYETRQKTKLTAGFLQPLVSKSHHRHKSRYPHSFRGDDRELLSRGGAHTKTAIKFTLQSPCVVHQPTSVKSWCGGASVLNHLQMLMATGARAAAAGVYNPSAKNNPFLMGE